MDSVKIIKKMVPIHCARGPKVCEKCKALTLEGKKLCLIKVYLKPSNVTRPITEIYVGCRRIIGEFDILKIFEDNEEALKYSRNNNVDIQLD
ncbi:MAG: hypothetical protein EU539_03350 [Promethearchaeota archaeon]|nr:MAG: hypothetical protein EU539_03350 [Candidatus Lokiarchaeota archaeon]